VYSLAKEIDLKTEIIILSDPQPTSLSVPADKPCYLLYRHSAGVGKFLWFIHREWAHTEFWILNHQFSSTLVHLRHLSSHDSSIPLPSSYSTNLLRKNMQESKYSRRWVLREERLMVFTLAW